MRNISEEILKKIRKKIKYLSQTAEFLVRKEFQKQGYMASTFYYIDHDPERDRDVVRELDFYAKKMWLHQLPEPVLHPKTEITKTVLRTGITFLGEVKYNKGFEERIILGLKPSKEFYPTVGSELLGIVYLLEALASMIPNDLRKHFFSTNEFIKKLEELMPISHHVLFFKPDGEEWEPPFRDWCEQIVSAFYNIKRVDTEKSPEVLDWDVEIPMLIFGNKTHFIVYPPEDVDEAQPIYPDAILYIFQSAQKPLDELKYLIPIIVTSLKKLPQVISYIEKEVIQRIYLTDATEGLVKLGPESYTQKDCSNEDEMARK